jgi:branched-chain amino acid transport system permease protein
VGQLPQQIVNGLWQGGALALFAVGYALVFGSLDIINLAHGATYMWGAFIAFVVVTKLGWPIWIAIPIAMAGTGVLAVLLDLLAFKPLRALTRGSLVLWGGFLLLVVGLISPLDLSLKIIVTGAGGIVMAAGIVQDYQAISPLRQQQVPPLAPMISSIGASIVLVSLAQGTFSSQVSRFPIDTFPIMPYELPGGVVIAPIQLLVLGLSVGLILALQLLLGRTSMGRAIRAIAWNTRTSRLLGINVDLVVGQTFFLSGALAGAAGSLLGLAFNRLEPIMVNDIELAGLTVIVVGGMGSVGGAALAALLVGMLRVMSVAYLDSSARDALVFLLLIVVLLVRPSGLFGRGRMVRA